MCVLAGFREEMPDVTGRLYSNLNSVISLESEVKVARSCTTLWDPMDYKIHGILKARRLERAAFPFSRGSSKPRDRTQVSCIAGSFFTS